jgi:hypothetical protein
VTSYAVGNKSLFLKVKQLQREAQLSPQYSKLQPAAPVLLLPLQSSQDVEIKEFKRVGLQRRTSRSVIKGMFLVRACVRACVCGRDIRRILFYEDDTIWKDFSLLLFVMLHVTLL